MLKSVIAVGTFVAALFLGCGVAQADDVDDAINDFPFFPGMVEYLQDTRALFDATGDPDYVWNVGNVGDAASLGLIACDPQIDFLGLPMDFRKAIATSAIEDNSPLVSEGWLEAVDQLCTNY